MQHLIDKASSDASFSFEDAFPKVSLSAEKLKIFITLVIVKRMKIIVTSQDECWLVMFSRTKWIKLMIQIPRDNVNTINDGNRNVR